MNLTPEEKAARARDRMIATANKYQVGTYSSRFVAPLFQRMIRAEAAAEASGYTSAATKNCGALGISNVWRYRGECVCVTCGKIGPWSGGLGGMHTGHFLASRRHSILFEEDNVAPQCSYCNRYRGGAPQEFRLWMEHVRGAETIARLEQLKTTVRHFSREELVDMRIAYQLRLDEAVELMRL